MREWLIARDIGQRRAALIDDGRIIAARIERDSDGCGAGAIVAGRLIDGRAHLFRTDDGEEVLIDGRASPWPADGARALVTIRRAAIPERDLVKRAVGRLIDDDTAARPTPPLAEALAADGVRVREDRAALDAAGWDELIEEARTGHVAFDGGLLRIDITAAMTVIDVDGVIDAERLAVRGAAAAAAAIQRLDIGGNIVIDLPTMANRAARQAADAAFDAACSERVERTATNGYGLLQIIRPRQRPNIIERIRLAPVESAALDLLRHAEAARGAGVLTLTAHPRVIDWLAARPTLTDQLARRSGRAIALRGDAAMGIDAGYAQ